MTSVFKLTKAEFVKIFKRPSIFIMAVLLVISIFVSVSIFDPTTRIDNTITYDSASNAQEYYDTFYDDNSINNKLSFDDGFSKTDNLIKYYQSENANTNLLINCHNKVIDTMQKMINDTYITTRDNLRKDLIKYLEEYITIYTGLDSIKEFTNISDAIITPVEYEGSQPQSYYTVNSCVALNQFYNYVTNNELSSNDVVNVYNTNKFKEKLDKVLNNGINYIYTAIKGMVSVDIPRFYDNYGNYVALGQSNINMIKSSKDNLLKSLNVFYDYYNALLNNEFPVILVNNDTHQTIKTKVEESIEYLKLSVTDNNNPNKHKDVKANLDKIGLITYLKSLVNAETSSHDTKIVQVHISDRLVNELLSYQKTVNKNKTDILKKIDDKIADESIKNIQQEITNYSLLEDSYDKLINQKLLSHITSDYDQSSYQNFHGYNFKEFNKFQSTESITLSKYYIINNKYENSYLTNFSYNQTSGEKTNMYDFIYFSMELCTLIIIIFAMMMVCNLITGETESGTIKLLLVRPYRRSKILTAKLLATIFFVLSFMVFSSILTFVGGYFLYGPTTASVVSIFNGVTAFEIAPFWLMIINIFTLILDVIFFILLALMISILCKNYAASISCSLVLLIINFAFNILFGNTFWYTLLPGMNLHLFKYFGNSFISITGLGSIASVIQSLLITIIQTSMSFWFSLIASGIYSIVFIAVSYAVFQNRDF